MVDIPPPKFGGCERDRLAELLKLVPEPVAENIGKYGLIEIRMTHNSTVKEQSLRPERAGPISSQTTRRIRKLVLN